MAEWGSGVDLPGTEELASTNLAIPISPVLTAGQAARVVETIEDALSKLD
jgi:dTDP-4-amino-4,6-dideoxygalactose transaminase